MIIRQCAAAVNVPIITMVKQMELGYFVTETQPFPDNSCCLLYGSWHRGAFADSNRWSSRDTAVVDRKGCRIQEIEITEIRIDGDPACHRASPKPVAVTPFFLTDRTDYRLVYADYVSFVPRDDEVVKLLCSPMSGYVFPVFGRGWAGALLRRRKGWFRRTQRWFLHAYSARADIQIGGNIAWDPELTESVLGKVASSTSQSSTSFHFCLAG